MAEELTYEEKARGARLERREWDRIWIEDTTEATEPRVLYIGDSISNGTHLNATKAAERKILFNCYATSKAVDNPYFYPQLKMFIEQCEKRLAVLKEFAPEEMSEEAIRILHDDAWEEFKADRNYILHTQDLPSDSLK